MLTLQILSEPLTERVLQRLPGAMLCVIPAGRLDVAALEPTLKAEFRQVAPHLETLFSQ
jgi:hypothetical protein